MRLASELESPTPESHERTSSLAERSNIALLGLALRKFFAAWSVVRYPLPLVSSPREASIGLALCVAVVVIGYAGDAACARWIRTFPAPVWRFFGDVTLLGTSGYIFALCMLVAVIAVLARGAGSAGRQFRAGMDALAGRAMFVFATNAASGIGSQVVKHVAGRARPKLMSLVGPFHFDLFSIKASLASFPSGHTVTVFATATALSYFAPRLRLWLFGLAVLVAISRIAIGAHYPSDVLAGSILGTGTSIYLRRAFAARGLVFRPVGERIRARRASSLVEAFKFLVDGVRR